MRQSCIKLIRTLICGVVIFGGSLAAFGQFGSGVQGTVSDSSGAVVPGATVTVTNIATNRSTDVTTNDSGFYSVSGLAQGTYRVTVTRQGFSKKVVDNFVVAAETTAGLDVTLDTGEVSVEVRVDAADAAPALETETANLGRNITTQEVLQLPQVGRDPYQLARLAPGVFGDGARAAGGGAARIGNNQTGPGGSNNGIFAVENQTQISANGQRVTSNSYEIDGVSVNSQTWAARR